MNHRWMKFWPSDWKGDAALRICGLAARGLWIECIAIMHEAQPYGHLVVNARPLNARQIAAIVGSSERDVTKLLAELEDAGVFSRTEAGVIFSRRMVRDNEKSEEGRTAIAKRWTNKVDDAEPITPPITPPNRGPCSLDTDTEREKTEKKELPSQPSVGRSPRGSRLPPDWTPDSELRTFATDLGLAPDTVAANFRDYWHAKPGKEAVKLDWPATWRGWCRREAERNPTGPLRRPAIAKPHALDGWLAMTGSERSPTFDMETTAEEIT